MRSGKGGRDRITFLPQIAQPELRRQLKRAEAAWRKDRATGSRGVKLPHAIGLEYPGAALQWPWYWEFPASKPTRDRETGETFRHHLHESAVQRAVRSAADRATPTKRASCHTPRHSFATHLLERGAENGPFGLRSPADPEWTEDHTLAAQAPWTALPAAQPAPPHQA